MQLLQERAAEEEVDVGQLIRAYLYDAVQRDTLSGDEVRLMGTKQDNPGTLFFYWTNLVPVEPSGGLRPVDPEAPHVRSLPRAA